MRLRGQVGVLHDTVEKTQGELATAQSENAQMVALFKAEAIRAVTINALKQVGNASHMYAGDHRNLLPTNIGQIRGLLADVNFGSGVGTNSFEFYDYGKPLPTGATPYFFLAREKQPRQMPDGKWSRIYLHVDGYVQEATTDDGNFDAWEKDWIQQAAQKFGPPVSQ